MGTTQQKYFLLGGTPKEVFLDLRSKVQYALKDANKKVTHKSAKNAWINNASQIIDLETVNHLLFSLKFLETKKQVNLLAENLAEKVQLSNPLLYAPRIRKKHQCATYLEEILSEIAEKLN